LARPIRFYGKKRGDRRTGSNQLGRLWLGLFSGACLLAGIVPLVYILIEFAIPEWRVHHRFIHTTARVVSTEIVEWQDDKFSPEILLEYHLATRPDGDLLTARSDYEIVAVHSRSQQHWERPYVEEILAQFPVGSEHDSWYDPRHPDTIVLMQAYTWSAWLMLLLPVAFITIGGGGLIFVVLTWGKSTERLSAGSQRPSGLDLFQTPSRGGPAAQFPFVPDPDELGDSPGTLLAHRLPPAKAEWRLFAAVAFCLFWNSLVAFFLTSAIQDIRDGDPDWWMIAFVTPCLIIGLGSIAYVGRLLLIAGGVGPTIVEVSDYPLTLGGEYELALTQTGRLHIESLDVRLVCEEMATFHQGTNSRATVRRVYEQLLISRQNFEIHHGLPFEARARLPVPAAAMHSFQATHNRVEWKIVVRGAVQRWPDFERGFPLVVCPASGSGVPT
jgi:hypothetical protein